MKRLFLAAAMLALSSATGCVVCTEPVGVPVQADLSKQLDGVWRVDETVWHVKYLGQGKVRLATVEKDGDHFKLKEETGLLTKVGDTMLLNFPLRKDQEPVRYFFMRVDLKEDEATVCYPPNAAFHDAVQKGQLKGKVDKDKNGNPALVTLEDHGQLEKFIQAHGAGELFKLDQSHVFRRLRKEKKMAAAAAHADKAPDKANEDLNR